MDWHAELENLEGWHFGGKGSGIEDELAALVVAGIKTATCSWYETYALDSEPLPLVDEVSYILNAKDEPVCVVRVTEVTTMPFEDVDADFAYSEGEGDRTYAYWRAAHEKFFGEYAQAVGLVWDAKTQHVVCERFEVLHVF